MPSIWKKAHPPKELAFSTALAISGTRMASKRPLARLALFRRGEKSAPLGGSNSPKTTNFPDLILSSNAISLPPARIRSEKQVVQANTSNPSIWQYFIFLKGI
jgi:hypothetical protein